MNKTNKEILESYLAQPHFAESTQKNKESNLTRFLNSVNRPLMQITEHEVVSWQQRLLDDGLKPSSVNQMMMDVQAFFGWINDRATQYIEHDSAIAIYQTKERLQRIRAIPAVRDAEGGNEGGNKQAKRALEPEQIIELASAAIDAGHPSDAQMYVLGAALGLRRTEMRLLHTKHIDYDQQRIEVPRASTKTAAGARVISFPDWLEEWLPEPGMDGYVLGYGRDQPYSESWFWNVTSQMYRGTDYRKGLGLDWITPHTFRRTFNTHMRPVMVEQLGTVKGGFMLKKVMGHSVKQDMSDLYMGETEQFERDRDEVMQRHHYLSPYVMDMLDK